MDDRLEKTGALMLFESDLMFATVTPSPPAIQTFTFFPPLLSRLLGQLKHIINRRRRKQL